MADIDCFDVLDVSLREDTYSSLIVHALQRSPKALAGVFDALTGQRLVRADDVYFRAGLADRRREDHPDIVIKGQTETGPWWLVIEAKVQSDEGERQSERYRSGCRRARDHGEIAGFSLMHLTLSGEEPETPEWRPLTHYELAALISGSDVDQVLQDDSAFALPWSSYLARLRHHREYRRPADDEAMLPWLENAENSFFVSRGERAAMLGPLLAVPGYRVRSFAMTRQGRNQLLLQVWKPNWVTGKWDPDGSNPLEECISVHFELDVPLPNKRSGATCHLHCESNPYKTRAQLGKIGPRARQFTEFVEEFRRELHRRVPIGSWKLTNHALQKAKCICPFGPETTMGELRRTLPPLLAEVEEAVETAMLAAGRSCDLVWASNLPSQL